MNIVRAGGMGVCVLGVVLNIGVLFMATETTTIPLHIGCLMVCLVCFFIWTQD